jgi:hypothetical protein
MTPETEINVKQRALDALLRTDGVVADTAEVLKSAEGRNYVVLYQGRARRASNVAAVYKIGLRPGPAKAVPGGAFLVDSLSITVKRLKRVPKGLLNF